MPSPIPPSALKALVPSATGNFCEKFVAFLNFPKLVSQWMDYFYNEDGTFSDDAKVDICTVLCNCDDLPDLPPGTDPGTSALGKPASVAATDGTVVGAVDVTWASVTGADSYEIWAAEQSMFLSDAVKVGDVTATTFSYTNVTVGKTYFFWIRAKKTTSLSVFSDSDSGYPRPHLVSGTQEFLTPGTFQFVVPADVTSLNCDSAAGGGGGGGAAKANNTYAAGGGGGGGSARNVAMAIVVVPGETLTVVVGDGGLGGVHSISPTVNPAIGASGLPGQISSLLRSSTPLAAAAPGGGGVGGIAVYTGDGPQGGPGGVGGSGALPGQNGFDGQGNTFPAAPGGPGGPGNLGVIGAGGNGGSVSTGQMLQSGKGRAGRVYLYW